MEVKFRGDGIVVTGDPHEIARFIGLFLREFRSEMSPLLAKQITSLQFPPPAAPQGAGQTNPTERAASTLSQWYDRVQSIPGPEFDKWLIDHPDAKVQDFAIHFLGGSVDFHGPMQPIYTKIYNRIAHTRRRLKLKAQGSQGGA
jgi:hypothetical protein